MTHYIASVTYCDSRRKVEIIERDYETKKQFYYDLRANGYSVRFITTEEKFDEDCTKWHMANERKKEISKRRTQIRKEREARGFY